MTSDDVFFMSRKFEKKLLLAACRACRCINLYSVVLFPIAFRKMHQTPFDSKEKDFHGLAISSLNPACNVNAQHKRYFAS